MKKAIEEGKSDSQLTQTDINLSTLISMDMKEETVEISKNGFGALKMMAQVSPVQENDIDFVQQHVNFTNKYNLTPRLQSPSHEHQ